MGFMELRVWTVGFRLANRPILLLVQIKILNVDKSKNGFQMVLEAKRRLLITKQNHKVSHLYLYSCQKMELWTYLIYFHTFSYKFKV